jgi:carbonic anhydrase/acetyltransferase-like protein (isoleucine patch superfamily)
MIVRLGERVPEVAGTAWVADGATVVGSVTLGEHVGVFYGAVLRGDMQPITIGDRSNLQDGVVVHTDPGFPVTVGTGVSVGHNAVLHGCTIEVRRELTEDEKQHVRSNADVYVELARRHAEDAHPISR